MEKKTNFGNALLQVLSYILVAAAAAAATLFLCMGNNIVGVSKLDRLQNLIDRTFVGEVDMEKVEDAAAAEMVAALGDRWSVYLPKDAYLSYIDQMNNSYVGIGITVQLREDNKGIDIISVEPAGGAYAAGIKPGDVLIAVENKPVASVDDTRALVQGEEGTKVKLTVLRGEKELDFTVERKKIETPVATGQMLDGKIGYIRIKNFDSRSAEETIAQINKLRKEGAKSLVFDVRNNPGGYKNELVKILDYLLPEKEVFCSVDYNGKKEVDMSDAHCLEMPMAVLVNGESYSAAEFFAAALMEYDWAEIVGEPTVGKGYFQNTFELGDGSAVSLSVGKYYTPMGKSLAEEGGLQPDVNSPVDEETAMKIYYEELPLEEDPQVQDAIAAISGK